MATSKKQPLTAQSHIIILKRAPLRSCVPPICGSHLSCICACFWPDLRFFFQGILMGWKSFRLPTNRWKSTIPTEPRRLCFPTRSAKRYIPMAANKYLSSRMRAKLINSPCLMCNWTQPPAQVLSPMGDFKMPSAYAKVEGFNFIYWEALAGKRCRSFDDSQRGHWNMSCKSRVRRKNKTSADEGQLDCPCFAMHIASQLEC
jgi:hypothetical protein